MNIWEFFVHVFKIFFSFLSFWAMAAISLFLVDKSSLTYTCSSQKSGMSWYFVLCLPASEPILGISFLLGRVWHTEMSVSQREILSLSSTNDTTWSSKEAFWLSRHLRRWLEHKTYLVFKPVIIISSWRVYCSRSSMRCWSRNILYLCLPFLS